MGANSRRIREDKEQPAEHAERRRKRNSCQGGHSVSVLTRVHPWSIPLFAPGRPETGPAPHYPVGDRAGWGGYLPVFACIFAVLGEAATGTHIAAICQNGR